MVAIFLESFWLWLVNMGLMIKKMAAGFTVLVMMLGLSGCLFAARPKAAVPYQAVAITGSPSPQLLGQLQVDILTYIDVKVAIAPKDADLIVEIMQDTPNSQIASYTGMGQITAYDLNDVVVFRAFDKTGHELIAQTQIYAVRDVNFSPHNVLSADIQQQQMISDMRKELAFQITMRLMALGRHSIK